MIGVLSLTIYEGDIGLTGTLLGLMIVIPLIWLRPSFGVYLIVISATIFETFRLNFPDSITDRARVFQTFSSAR